MLRKLSLAAGVGFALVAPAYAADPQKFTTEDGATKLCKAGNVVWFNPARRSISTPTRSSTARRRLAASPAGLSQTRQDSGPTREIIARGIAPAETANDPTFSE
jgi:hypothetical protein